MSPHNWSHEFASAGGRNRSKTSRDGGGRSSTELQKMKVKHTVKHKHLQGELWLPNISDGTRLFIITFRLFLPLHVFVSNDSRKETSVVQSRVASGK